MFGATLATVHTFATVVPGVTLGKSTSAVVAGCPIQYLPPLQESTLLLLRFVARAQECA